MERKHNYDQEKRTTWIDNNISKYLFLQFPCPNCGQVAEVSLYIIHAHEWMVCQQCNKWFIPRIKGDNLTRFIQSFDLLHEQLRKIGLQLFFCHEQMPTIRSPNDKP
jgi:predicted RNA-binding Zn-ribbon protein involved in translation (DUF1610 family)